MFIGDTSKKSCMETKDKRAEKKTVSFERAKRDTQRMNAKGIKRRMNKNSHNGILSTNQFFSVLDSIIYFVFWLALGSIGEATKPSSRIIRKTQKYFH